jgi:hypothetical protein
MCSKNSCFCLVWNWIIDIGDLIINISKITLWDLSCKSLKEECLKSPFASCFWSNTYNYFIEHIKYINYQLILKVNPNYWNFRFVINIALHYLPCDRYSRKVVWILISLIWIINVSAINFTARLDKTMCNWITRTRYNRK